MAPAIKSVPNYTFLVNESRSWNFEIWEATVYSQTNNELLKTASNKMSVKIKELITP